MTPASSARTILERFRGIMLVPVVPFKDRARGNRWEASMVMIVVRNAANRHRNSMALKWWLSPDAFRVRVSVISMNIRTGVMVPNVDMNRALNLLT